MHKSNQKIYALAIVAHPDDESFLLAGTCLKFAEEGKRVQIYCATKGEKGADRQGRHLTLAEMAKIRMQELRQACACIHCGGPEFGDYKDGELDQVNFSDLVDDLKSKIQEYAPEIILTFGDEGVTGHKDHVVIGKASMEAAKTADPKPKQVWRVCMPGSAMTDFNNYLSTRKVHHTHYHDQVLVGVHEEKLLKVDIRKFSDQKHEAIKAHQSQYLPTFVTDLFLEFEYFEVQELS